jgi:hypothetical protein
VVFWLARNKRTRYFFFLAAGFFFGAAFLTGFLATDFFLAGAFFATFAFGAAFFLAGAFFAGFLAAGFLVVLLVAICTNKITKYADKVRRIPR